jgi:hypothetical protein
MSPRKKTLNQPIQQPVQRLTRAPQLTLTTRRFAARKLDRVLEPAALFECVAAARHWVWRERHAESQPGA